MLIYICVKSLLILGVLLKSYDSLPGASSNTNAERKNPRTVTVMVLTSVDIPEPLCSYIPLVAG